MCWNHSDLKCQKREISLRIDMIVTIVCYSFSFAFVSLSLFFSSPIVFCRKVGCLQILCCVRKLLHLKWLSQKLSKMVSSTNDKADVEQMELELKCIDEFMYNVTRSDLVMNRSGKSLSLPSVFHRHSNRFHYYCCLRSAEILNKTTKPSNRIEITKIKIY